ncbi:hypothetical protein BT67DRAFT_159728 [Trichocladium antarcticum]|uniref:Uncharacterized protein n=1 Tax=Trichocladium antarcticum TaxID=1450529 RepID=A0AAN6UEM3_9PEZI|nr:hypothetical protein BT67DRAFT_159728 [Trichocladium antarcticum]
MRVVVFGLRIGVATGLGSDISVSSRRPEHCLFSGADPPLLRSPADGGCVESSGSFSDAVARGCVCGCVTHCCLFVKDPDKQRSWMLKAPAESNWDRGAEMV